MRQGEAKVSFKNLEPLNYLKTFNRMVDVNQRHAIPTNPRKELKTVSLTKFPLPAYYQNMEGIFESSARKKVEPAHSKVNQKQIEEEQFMEKHNNFMRKVLSKFIRHNQDRQHLFEQDKQYVRRNNDPNHLRSLSQPKLDKKKDKENQHNPEPQRSDFNLATKGSADIVQTDKKDQIISVLPRVKAPKKKQKYKVRKQHFVEEAIINRKLTAPSPSPVPPSRSSMRNEGDGENVDFREDIVNLQNKQVSKQEIFSEKIERQIAEFDKKMDVQVHSIRYYNFWKEPVSYDSQQVVSKKKVAGSIDGHAEMAINFRNFQSS